MSFSQDLALCGTFVAFAQEHAGIEFEFHATGFQLKKQAVTYNSMM